MKQSQATYDDQRHPIRHDVPDETKAIKAIINAKLRWVDSLERAEDRERYCGHGQYVGFQGALKYRCRLCVEEQQEETNGSEDGNDD